MAEEFVFMGAVQDNQPYVTQKGRVDKRLISTVREKFILNNGEEYVLLDAKERGDLYEIRVISDNPYLEVFLELDEWINENASAADILAQPDTGRLLSNFQAIDGGHPGIGYTLIYNPDIPEDYDGRIRVVLRNRIRPSREPFGVFGGYNSKGNLATPTQGSFIGGFSIDIPQLSPFTNDVLVEAIGYTMATNPSIEPLFNPGESNSLFHSAKGLGRKKGALHPFLGIAGRPILNFDSGPTSNQFLQVFWDEPDDKTQQKERVWGSTSQDIYIVDFSGVKVVTAMAGGDRVYVRDGGLFHFPGELTEEPQTEQSLPTRFASNGGVAYTGALKLTVNPGMKSIPASSRITAGGGLGGSPDGGYGVVTTPGDTAPPVFIRKAEIKRLKRVSYDG